MKTISIKELHDKTGLWLRRVKAEGELVVTERGNPLALIARIAFPRSGEVDALAHLDQRVGGVACLANWPKRGPLG